MPTRTSKKGASAQTSVAAVRRGIVKGAKSSSSSATASHASVLSELGLDARATLPGTSDGRTWKAGSGTLEVRTPIDRSLIARVGLTDAATYEWVVSRLAKAFPAWRDTPMPKRGEVVRQWGNRLRELKEPLGRLVSLETGKSLQEGLGEVQEMIDICDYAVGLGRMAGGRTIPSERVEHRMMEQWHPLGVVGVVTAFNFPVAVYAWNAAIALVCGDVVLWKPSEKTPVTAVAVQRILNEVLAACGHPGVAGLVVGPRHPVGDLLVNDRRVPLVSATGSCRMGEQVGPAVAGRHGRTILELGGNNAVVVAPSADMDLALRAVLFGAVGTAGQRCTSTRRLILHDSIHDAFLRRLVEAYKQVRIGDPLDPKNVMGPLIDEAAVTGYTQALQVAQKQGGRILFGGKAIPALGTCYVEPTLVAAPKGKFPIAQEETFAPILYVFRYKQFDEALELHNGVRQGLSSSLFTNDAREAERFVSAAGSDCGIANVNLGTSGAEIGGAFGGEKETGGGRESGSDAWKQYMRRSTNTVNYGTTLPLAQGIEFSM